LGAAIIVVDKRQRERQDSGEPDLRDQNVGLWVMLFLIFGGFVFPFYFWNTRRTLASAIGGCGITLAYALILTHVVPI
jgi:hypothetical protein